MPNSLPSDPQNTTNIAVRFIHQFNPMNIRKRGTKSKALFALGMVCFFWGTTWLATKEGVQHMPALEMAGIRQFIGGLCYVVFFMVKGTPLPRGKEWGPILVLSILNFMLSNGFSTWGVQYISAGLGSIIGAIFPLWIVVISLFANKSQLKTNAIIGLLLGFGGICVIFYEHLHDFLDPGFRFGILISLVSTLSWAFGTIYTKKHALHFNPYFGLGLQMVLSGITLFSVSNLTQHAIPVTAIPWQSWAAMGYLVVFGSVISFMAYLYALQNLPTEQSSLYAYINPIVAVMLGWIIFQETLTPFLIIGVLIALLGVYLVNRASTSS